MRQQHPRRRTASWSVGLVVAVLALGGCSEDDGEDYCAALAEEQKTLTDLADTSGEGGDVLTPTLESFEKLQDAAPEELQDEWDTLVVAYQSLVDAVEQAGIDPEDYRPDRPPSGVSEEDAERLASVASKLASTRVGEAAAGIEQHAGEVCEVEFTG
jgi:hypothetical protein